MFIKAAIKSTLPPKVLNFLVLKKNQALLLAFKNTLKEIKLVDDPIFIVGCGHSGTSLMLAILDHHPSIYGIDYESNIFLDARPFAPPLRIIKSFQKWGRSCLEANKKRWGEKTPRHILHLPEIFFCYPNCRVILMLRDGRDVACSIKDRTGSFEQGISRWVNHNLAGFPYWGDSRVKVVKYEDLVKNSQKTLQEVCDFIGEEYTQEMLKYNEKPRDWYASNTNARSHEKYRNWQINQPLFDGRNKWKNKINEEEKQFFKEKAQKYMIEFGYQIDDNW